MFRLLTTFTANADGLNACENAYILVGAQTAQSYPVLLITLYLYILNSILKIIRKSCVFTLYLYIIV